MRLVEQGYEILTDISSGGIEELQKIERAGRVCYKSEDKISPDGESAKRFCKMLIKNGHEAMLEHSSLTVRFVCSRGVSHELVRHRLFSFAQESTRYCNYSSEKFYNSVTFIIPPDLSDDEKNFLYEAVAEGAWRTKIYLALDEWLIAMDSAENGYFALLNNGWKPEQARDVLPNALKTEIVVTGNYREWRHFFKLRTDNHAHPHIRALAQLLLMEVKERIPVVFDDI